MIKTITVAFMLAATHVVAADEPKTFTDEELSVAEFWKQMGPTLRDEGIEAYAIRYHEDFTHWIADVGGAIATKENAVTYYAKFHDAGHRITCAHVEPVTIDIRGDTAIARMIYEQTNSYVDGRVDTNTWRMIGIFERFGDTWQALSTNMVTLTLAKDTNSESSASATYTLTCPTG